jgi:GNAT superfamily N-acetyltransferase
MRSQRVRMTVEEYELLPFKPGWQCEYLGGYAHFTPRSHPVVTSVEVAPRRVETALRLRPAAPADVESLVGPYAAAFGGTIEYCDSTPGQVIQAARDALRSHFAGARGEPHAASQVALGGGGASGEGEVVGAALVALGEFGAMLDLLFVTPERQRGGVASALVAAAVNDLHRLGHRTLTSRYHIGNEASRDWHRRFGFVELPDLTAARLYEREARQELRRQEKLGPLSRAERARLSARCRHWREQVKRLEELEAAQGYEAVHPNLRWW